MPHVIVKEARRLRSPEGEVFDLFLGDRPQAVPERFLADAIYGASLEDRSLVLVDTTEPTAEVIETPVTPADQQERRAKRSKDSAIPASELNSSRAE